MEKEKLTQELNIQKEKKNELPRGYPNHKHFHHFLPFGSQPKAYVLNLLILSIAEAIFCSSSGHISGQWVNPK